MKYNNNEGPKNGVSLICSAINSWKFALQKFGWDEKVEGKNDEIQSEFTLKHKEFYHDWELRNW